MCHTRPVLPPSSLAESKPCDKQATLLCQWLMAKHQHANIVPAVLHHCVLAYRTVRRWWCASLASISPCTACWSLSLLCTVEYSTFLEAQHVPLAAHCHPPLQRQPAQATLRGRLWLALHRRVVVAAAMMVLLAVLFHGVRMCAWRPAVTAMVVAGRTLAAVVALGIEHGTGVGGRFQVYSCCQSEALGA